MFDYIQTGGRFMLALNGFAFIFLVIATIIRFGKNKSKISRIMVGVALFCLLGVGIGSIYLLMGTVVNSGACKIARQ